MFAREMESVPSRAERRKRLLFYSRYAFYKPHFKVFELLCANFNLDGFIITHEKADVPRVYSQSGFLSSESAGLVQLPDYVTVVPRDLAPEAQLALIEQKTKQISPDYIWAHEEPINPVVNKMLQWFYLRRSPRIIIHVVDNIWRRPGGISGCLALLWRRVLWRRYGGVLACATRSMQAIRPYGMPRNVPIRLAWLPHVSPPPQSEDDIAGCFPQKKPGEVFVGFAGRITAAKGWHVLLAALIQLPPSIKCLIAGTGDDEALLRLWCSSPQLQDRVYFLGVMAKDTLWSFYRKLDLFVLPSLTTPTWMEQFGCVLAESMACGIPVIGSSSGAIPEVIGEAGVVVEEQNPTALAEAIRRLASDLELRKSLAEEGIRRFRKEFTCEAYAQRVAEALGLAQWLSKDEGQGLASPPAKPESTGM